MLYGVVMAVVLDGVDVVVVGDGCCIGLWRMLFKVPLGVFKLRCK